MTTQAHQLAKPCACTRDSLCRQRRKHAGLRMDQKPKQGQRAFVMQPRSAERQRVLSWKSRHPRSPPDHEPQGGFVTLEANPMRGGREHRVAFLPDAERVLKVADARMLATESLFDCLTDPAGRWLHRGRPPFHRHHPRRAAGSNRRRQKGRCCPIGWDGCWLVLTAQSVRVCAGKPGGCLKMRLQPAWCRHQSSPILRQAQPLLQPKRAHHFHPAHEWRGQDRRRR